MKVEFESREQFAAFLICKPLYTKDGGKAYFDANEKEYFIYKTCGGKKLSLDLSSFNTVYWHDKELIQHLDLFECWDNNDYCRFLMFWNFETGTCYNKQGIDHPSVFDNYKKIDRKDWPEWAIETHSILI